MGALAPPAAADATAVFCCACCAEYALDALLLPATFAVALEPFGKTSAEVFAEAYTPDTFIELTRGHRQVQLQNEEKQEKKKTIVFRGVRDVKAAGCQMSLPAQYSAKT